MLGRVLTEVKAVGPFSKAHADVRLPSVVLDANHKVPRRVEDGLDARLRGIVRRFRKHFGVIQLATIHAHGRLQTHDRLCCIISARALPE